MFNGGIMIEYYTWLKAVHLIAVISWMAGLLYLPRLYVYHTELEVGSEEDKRFQIMERKLLRFIMNPAAITVLIVGLMLAHIGQSYSMGWFHVKALLLIGMFATHGMLAKYRKLFVDGKNTHSAKFYKILNEAPAVLMVLIVIIAVVKPF
jgi:putative membrane protein